MTFASHERTGKGAVDAASSAALRVRVLVTLVAFMTLVAGGEHTLVAADVVVSEIHYHPLASEGEIEFIELENTTSRAIDLSGWAFTEGIAYEFPEGTVIEPHGLIVLCRDPDTLARSFGLDPSALHWWFGASLDNGGERLVLVDLEGRIVEEVEYDDDAPWDRDADGFGPSLERVCLEAPADLPNNWVADIERRPTPLAVSSIRVCPPPFLPPPRVALNEIYYHPFQDRDLEHEFVELVNTTSEPIDLAGYCFTQGIRFCFESSYVLEPGAYVVVARNVDALREAFGLDAVVGSFEGQLSNDGERITLVDPEGNLVDSVRYEDSGEWPVGPDSLGFSLEKIVATAPSDDPMSWSDSGSIPRSGWQTISVSGRGTSERLMIYAEGAAEFLLDDFELVDLADPETNLLANGAFDSGLDGWTIDGNHAGSMWSSDAPGREERGIDAEALLLVATDRGGGTRNSVLTDSTVPIDRSGDATYRLTFRYRHLSGAPGLVVRMSGSSPSRGLYFQVGAGAVVTPGAENVAARSALPPFVSQIHRAPKEPTSSDEVTLSARVRGDPNQVILEISLPYTTEEPFEIEMLDDGLSGDGAAGDGIWAATVPPQPHNSVVTYRVIARSAVGERTFPSRTDPQGFYGYYVNDGAGDSKLRTFSIILPPSYGPPRSAFTSMNCTVYRECSFAFEGDLWFNVGVRRRGGSVCGDGDVIKKYLKIKFPRGHEFEGQRKLNFQSLWTDKSLIRENLAWGIFQEMASPYCSHEFIRLHANGAYFGLYAALEHPDARFLERNGLDPEGNLYKATASREEANGTYEKKTNENGDMSDLREFLTAMHSTRPADLPAFFEERTDPDGIIDYQASQILMNNRDYPHKNHYLYHDVERGKWMPTAWDLDLSFGKRWDGTFEGVLNDQMDNPGITPWYTTNVRGEGVGNHLLDKFFAQGGTWFRRAYLVRLWNAIHEKFTIESYEAKIAAYRELLLEEQAEDIAVWGRSRPSANDPRAPAEFEPNLERVRQHIEIRRNYLINYLRNTERFSGADRLQITEIQYNPTGEDWAEFLELRNVSGRDVDVTGWTISGIGADADDGLWRFPDGTVIADGEVFVVARDPELLRVRYPSFDARVLGPYRGELDNDGEEIRVRDAGPGYPATVELVRYGKRDGWPARADGIGYSLELFPVEDLIDNDLPSAWRASLVRGGTPGRLPSPGGTQNFFARGLCNGDASLNITDAVFILRYRFGGGEEPSCFAACDANEDDSVDIDDAIAFLQFLFVPDGFAMPAPGPTGCAPIAEDLCAVSNCAQ